MRKSLLLLSFFLFTASQVLAQTCTYNAGSNVSYTYSELITASKCVEGSFTDLAIVNLSASNQKGYALLFDKDVTLNSISITFKGGQNSSPIVIPEGVTVKVNSFTIAGQTDKSKVLEVYGTLEVANTLDLGGVAMGITVGDGGGITAGAIAGAGSATLSCSAGSDCITTSTCEGDPNFCSAATASTLPVEWLYVRTSQDGAELEWATVQEINNDYFVVELSRDAQDWTQIKTVAGAGNTSERQYYSFSLAGFEGYQYARIKQVDYDGKFEYSALVKLKASKASAPGIQSLYPNPAVDQLKLEVASESPTQIRVRVLSVNGNALLQYDFSSVQGMQQYTLDLEGLEKGLYLLSLEDQLTGTTQLKRFHKQ